MRTSLGMNADLLPSEFLRHRQRNYEYMMELKEENLLLHFRREAGLTSCLECREDLHWGWDSPLSDLRGQVTGHYLSAAARYIHTTGDPFLKTRANHMVVEIAKCQEEHGNGWMFPIPEKSLYWLKRGKHSWAPQYVCHKCMLGMLEMYTFTGNRQALDVLLKAADWFVRFTADISPDLMDEMMDWEETGGMMELWADLYAITGEEKHLRLMRLYERRRLFEPLLRGEDMLTNMHANTTIPEIHGAARAYEVTGEERYRRIAEAYWDMAVTRRGMFATGGQTSGELWTPMGMQAARLDDKNQEHCVVYNMIRLADYLYRWSGKKEYADYIERNLWNGLLSQAHWQEDNNNEIDCDILHSEWKKGLVAYYQPLAPGSRKRWAHKTHCFWCCVDTMLQANTIFQDFSFYLQGSTLDIMQYHGAQCRFESEGKTMQARVEILPRTYQNIRYSTVQREYPSRPESWAVGITLHSDSPMDLQLSIRIPWWCQGTPSVSVNGTDASWKEEYGCILLTGKWSDDTIIVTFPKGLTVHRLPDEPDTVAFLDGPLVLAGLCAEERALYGDPDHLETILKPANERRWQEWLPNWQTRNQPVNFRFKPIYQIGNEQYTVYFPIEREKAKRPVS
ncbi:MAG: glycoside hydrolase family 127 protein [Clostridia bacterium]|nr:glycoside hydrolase family 127 protein [Clostridia bacterium]